MFHSQFVTIIYLYNPFATSFVWEYKSVIMLSNEYIGRI